MSDDTVDAATGLVCPNCANEKLSDFSLVERVPQIHKILQTTRAVETGVIEVVHEGDSVPEHDGASYFIACGQCYESFDIEDYPGARIELSEDSGIE